MLGRKMNNAIIHCKSYFNPCVVVLVAINIVLWNWNNVEGEGGAKTTQDCLQYITMAYNPSSQTHRLENNGHMKTERVPHGLQSMPRDGDWSD